MNPGSSKGVISIRALEKGDLNEVYDLICDLEEEKMDFLLFERNLVRNSEDANIRYFVATTGNRTIGFISLHIQHILHHNRPTGEIQELIIAPEYQGQGVGTMLMQKVEAIARELNLEELELTTKIYRERAHVFYKQLGYINTHLKYVKKIIR